MSHAGSKLILQQQIQAFLDDRTILVLEPTQNYRISLKQFLSNLKIRNVRFVSTGAEAKALMEHLSIGFFIAEWSNPEMNGLQFCREVRTFAKFNKIPFLLTSVENMRRDVVLASEVGVDGYLLKPFSFEDFRDQLAALCKERVGPNKLTTILNNGEQCLNEMDDLTASKFFTEARVQFPQSARALCGLAKVAILQKNEKAAIEYYREACRVNPLYIEAHKALLSIYEQNGNDHGVVHVTRLLHDISPDNPKYTLVLAKAYLEMDDLRNSEIFFRKTVRLSPRLADAYKGLGSVYLLNEDYEKAMVNFHRALDIDGKDIGTLNALGLLYIRLGRFKEGLEKYELILKVRPEDARVLFNMGHAYERMGELALAEKYYHSSLTYEPDYEKPFRGLERLRKAKAS